MDKIQFADLVYTPTDYAQLQKQLDEITTAVINAQNSAELTDLFIRSNDLMEAPQTAYHIALIRSHQDINNTFYQNAFHAESEGFNSLSSGKLLSAFLSSPYFVSLTNRYGKQLENRMRNRLLRASIDPALLNTDRRLIMEFHKLRSDLRAHFDNQLMSESELYGYFTDPDREKRTAAMTALADAFYAERSHFASLLHELIRVRNGIAKNAGFDSFVEYRDFYYERTSYGEKELQSLCDNMRKLMMPIYQDIRAHQKSMMGLDSVTVCDSSCYFTGGSATMSEYTHTLNDAVYNVFSMYSPALVSFYKTLQDAGCIDLRPSRNKVSGTCFTTDILMPGYHPFVFANLKDVTKSFHMVNCGIGTAYASSLISTKGYPGILRKTVTDAMEIPAKVLELISSKYAEELCGSDADKFRYEHFCNKVREMLSFCAYHETETWMYAHPEASFEEIAEKLHEIICTYDPEHDDSPLLDHHIREMNLCRNVSIYAYPRYCISLVLSQISAFSLYDRIRKDTVFGWKDFDMLCTYGGTRDYMDTLALVGMPTPFAPRSIERLAEFTKNELENLRKKL